jgi:UDP-N-acetyl-D-mannosaminuronic acid dehydrogenase
VKVKDCRTAELVKVAEGVYRDVNISLSNELYRLCEGLGIDFWEMRDAANHAFCHIHEPGLVGGHCIPVYPHFLINEHNVPLVKEARKLNEEMVAYYVKKVRQIAPSGKAGVVGLSYREGVRETVHTMSHKMITALKKAGYDVYGTDPLFTPQEVEKYFKIKPLTDYKKMDAIIILNKNTEHTKQLKKIKNKVVDTKNILK